MKAIMLALFTPLLVVVMLIATLLFLMAPYLLGIFFEWSEAVTCAGSLIWILLIAGIPFALDEYENC